MCHPVDLAKTLVVFHLLKQICLHLHCVFKIYETRCGCLCICFKFPGACFCQKLAESDKIWQRYHNNKKAEVFFETQCSLLCCSIFTLVLTDRPISHRVGTFYEHYAECQNNYFCRQQLEAQEFFRPNLHVFSLTQWQVASLEVSKT